jgi:predicted RNA-binding Zn-ribbon protein involved in translation (DUF1610 family)
MICLKCLESMKRTGWTPNPGIDPYLVQFKCPKCGLVQYAPEGKRVRVQGITIKTANR